MIEANLHWIEEYILPNRNCKKKSMVCTCTWSKNQSPVINFPDSLLSKSTSQQTVRKSSCAAMGTERIFSFFFCFEHAVFNSLKICISTMYIKSRFKKNPLVQENYQGLWNPQFQADQLTLSPPLADFAHHFTMYLSFGISDLSKAM